MNLIKVGNTVINLDQLVSMTLEEDNLVNVETTNRKGNYSLDSDYGLLVYFTPFSLQLIVYSLILIEKVVFKF